MQLAIANYTKHLPHLQEVWVPSVNLKSEKKILSYTIPYSYSITCSCSYSGMGTVTIVEAMTSILFGFLKLLHNLYTVATTSNVVTSSNSLSYTTANEVHAAITYLTVA